MGDESKSNSNSPEQDSAALGLATGFLVGGGRFSLTRELGRGGMSVVWLAHDERLDESVALKFLPAEVRADAVALGDMRRETQKSRKLAHPNIVRIYDLYEAPGEPAFISMEFVEGPNLHDLRAEQPNNVFTWEFLKPLIKQLCDALDYAHSEQIIHRDLKPANMMLDSKGRLKLADFGIAAVAADSTTRTLGRFAGTGTVTHMSPQQLDGKLCGISDDIYALGATLYELLTGHPPFYSGDIAYQVRNLAPQPISERLAELKIQNEIPRDVAAMIMACLSKSLESRPATAGAVAEWIGLTQTTAPSIHPTRSAPTEPEPTQEVVEEKYSEPIAEPDDISPETPTQKKSFWLWATAAAAVLLGVVGWFAIDHLRSDSREPTVVKTINDLHSPVTEPTAPTEDPAAIPPANTSLHPAAPTFNETGPGSLDIGFDPAGGPNSEIRTVAVQDDGGILVGGSFRIFNNEDTGGLVRLQSDGRLDLQQVPHVRGNVHAITVSTDKKILVGGSFDSVGGISRRGIARLNSDLTLDKSFDPGEGPNNREVWCMAVANGKIFIGGNFQKVDGFKSTRIARLNIDGQVDHTFDAGDGVNRIVWQLIPQVGGAVLIGGNFDGVQHKRRNHIARILSNGKLDPAYHASSDNNIHAMALQPDGKVIIGGDFNGVHRRPRSHVARLNSDGSLDENFTPPTINNGIRTVTLQGDGKIIVAGIFSEVGGLPRQGIARLKADGSLDESFVAAISSVVRKVVVQRDEKILVAGAFVGANNQPRHSIARFNSSGMAKQAAVGEEK